MAFSSQSTSDKTACINRGIENAGPRKRPGEEYVPDWFVRMWANRHRAAISGSAEALLQVGILRAELVAQLLAQRLVFFL